MKFFEIQTMEEFVQWSLSNVEEDIIIADILIAEGYPSIFSYHIFIDFWTTKNMPWILPVVITTADSGHELKCTIARVSWYARPKYACYKQLFFAHHKNNPFRHILYACVCIISAMK